jgi:hypothetical protein
VDLRTGTGDRSDLGVEADVPLTACEFGEPVTDLLVETAHQLRSPGDDCDRTAQRLEYVGELGRYVAAAEDDQPLWERFDAHDRVGRVELDPCLQHLVRNGDPRAGGDDDLVGGEHVAVGQAHRPRIEELRVLFEQGDVVRVLPVAAAGR